MTARVTWLKGYVSDLSIQLAPANPRPVRLALLGLGQGPGFLALERVLAGIELNPEWRALQLEDLAENALQITGIAGRHIVQAAAVDHDQRRIAAALMGIAHLGAEARTFRRLLFFDGGDQRTGEFRCLQFRHRRRTGFIHRLHPLADAAAIQARNVVQLGKDKKMQLALDAAFALSAQAAFSELCQ